MKKPFLYNRALALGLVIPFVLLFIVLSGGSALAKERAQRQSVFYDGVEGDGLSIRHDLDARLDAAYNMLTLAQRSNLRDDPLLEAIRQDHAALTEDVGIAESYALDQALDRDVKQLYARAEEMGLSEEDQRLLEKQYYEFLSREQTIGHDGYNAQAQAFTKPFPPSPPALSARSTAWNRWNTFAKPAAPLAAAPKDMEECA